MVKPFAVSVIPGDVILIAVCFFVCGFCCVEEIIAQEILFCQCNIQLELHYIHLRFLL